MEKELFICSKHEPSFETEQYEYEEEYPYEPNLAARRKNEWKYARKHAQILVDQDYELGKPLHYYSKTRPEFYYQRTNKTNNKGKHRTAYGNYNKSKNWPTNDKRKIESMINQIKDLNDK